MLAVDVGFAEAFGTYLRDYGCRVLRYEIAEPALDERPDILLALLRDQLTRDWGLAAGADLLAAERAAAAAEARRALARRDARDLARFERALGRALVAYPVREDNEFFTVSVPLALVRRTALEHGRRLAARGLLATVDDVFCLRPEELRAALEPGSDLRSLAARRQGERVWALAHPGPVSYGPAPAAPPPMSVLPLAARFPMAVVSWLLERALAHSNGDPASAVDSSVISGTPASPGRYTGPVRVIVSEQQFDRLRAGDVLVCPVTSPVWSILFPSIGALVTDVGGTLSHPAIIAREYRVPAVVATQVATSRLRDGQVVTVDGGTGRVELHS